MREGAVDGRRDGEAVVRLASEETRGATPDLLALALARYVEALDRRYPGGPDEMRRKALASRANIVAMPNRGQRR
jgi:hypothetical protein